jgi:2-dehydro-3-deoxygluconokinase
MGETMMAFEALSPGPLRESVLFRKWIGGAEDNFIIGLARLGFRCGWFSRLGPDEFGKEICRTIRGEGVDVSRVIYDSEAQTGVFFVESRAEGDPRCYYYRKFSAASRLSPEDIDPDYVRSARAIYLTGITPAVGDSARHAVEKLFSLSRSGRQTVIFDPNLRLKLWDIKRARDVLIPMMQQSSYVLPGEDELKLLMGNEHLDQAVRKAHSLDIRNLVLKRGAAGALLAFSDRPSLEVPAFILENPVSAMGAGDCFAAGFVAGLLKEQSFEECARWGNAMGAFCLMGSGPYQTLPDFEELRRFLAGKEVVSR